MDKPVQEFIYMEDVNSMISAAIGQIGAALHQKGIKLTDADEDKLWEALAKPLELICGCPYYRHEH